MATLKSDNSSATIHLIDGMMFTFVIQASFHWVCYTKFSKLYQYRAVVKEALVDAVA